MTLNRIKTGVPGLDEMLGEGLIEKRSYVLLGGPGAGKTIMSMHFLVEGAKNGEEGLFLALEETANELKENVTSFNWDLKRIKIIDTSHEGASGKWALKVESVIAGPELTLNNILSILREYIVKYKVKRVVIDSLTSIKLMHSSPLDYRRSLLTLIKFLNTVECTAILTSETAEEDSVMEEFLSSGVIRLGFVEHRGEWLHSVRIKKMRGMATDQHIRPMKITEKGMQVFSSENMPV